MTPHEQALAAAIELISTFSPFNAEGNAHIATAVVNTYLCARKEIDGAVMCVVPDWLNYTYTDPDFTIARAGGWNACRDAALASVDK